MNESVALDTATYLSFFAGIGGLGATMNATTYVPPCSENVLRDFYDNRKMTQKEIASLLGCSQKAVLTAMKKYSIPRRIAAKRDQIGSKNDRWKGSDAGYQAKHLRVDTLFGKPKRCSVCGCDDPRKTYDWANLSGNYDDPTDFKRMCRSCHRKYDNSRKKVV